MAWTAALLPRACLIGVCNETPRQLLLYVNGQAAGAHRE